MSMLIHLVATYFASVVQGNKQIVFHLNQTDIWQCQRLRQKELFTFLAKSKMTAIIINEVWIKVLTIEELTIAKQRSRDILSLSFTHLKHGQYAKKKKDTVGVNDNIYANK